MAIHLQTRIVDLRRNLLAMGAAVESRVAGVVRALETGDAELARTIKEGDAEIPVDGGEDPHEDVATELIRTEDVGCGGWL